MKIAFRVDDTDPEVWAFARNAAAQHIAEHSDRPNGFSHVVIYHRGGDVRASVWWTKGRNLSVTAWKRKEVQP